MSGTVWIRHPGTGGVSEVPADALPIYRQSGWEPMDDAEVSARADAAEQARLDAEAAMLAESGQVRADDPAVPDPVPAEQPADVADQADTDAPPTEDTGKRRAAKKEG